MGPWFGVIADGTGTATKKVAFGNFNPHSVRTVVEVVGRVSKTFVKRGEIMFLCVLQQFHQDLYGISRSVTSNRTNVVPSCDVKPYRNLVEFLTL